MINIDHLERRIKYRNEDEPLLPPTPEEVLEMIAEIRRLQGILSDYNGTEKEVLMARVEKLERENRALGKMMGERKEHRRCKCGGDPVERKGANGSFWIDCDYCYFGTNAEETLDAAWAAWDGVEP